MILSLIAMLLVVLVTVFWAFQGVFSAAIMLIETLGAVMLAFGYYESLHRAWAELIHVEYSRAAALALIFVVSLAVLRISTDKLIPGNIIFPPAADRAGGGVLGLFIGLTVIGTVLTAVQMLPLGPDLLGFRRYDPGSPNVRRAVWLNPDGFVVGLVNLLSEPTRFGAAEGGFARARPRFLDDLYAVNAGFQRESRRIVPANSLAALAYWETRQIEQVDQQPGGRSDWTRNFSPLPLDDPGRKFVIVRVALDPSAADEAADSPAMIRFTPAQLRLVGPRPRPDGEARDLQLFMAAGLSDLFCQKSDHKLTLRQAKRIVKWPLNMRFGLNDQIGSALRQARGFLFDVAFDVPAGFEPWYVEFKSGARAELTERLKQKAPLPLAPPKPDATADPTTSEKGRRTGSGSDDAGGWEDEDEGGSERPQSRARVGPRRPGRTNLAAAEESLTGVSSRLPVVLPRSSFPDGTLRRGKFAGGHLAVAVPTAPPPRDQAVTEFEVPRELTMVQVGGEVVLAQSVLGKALEFAKRAVSQVYVTTESGEKYFALGVYTLATFRGQRRFEIQYWPETREEVPERCLKEPKEMTPAVLRTAADREDLKMGFLFLVPAGEKIVRFSTSPRDAQDVSIEVPK